MDGKNVVIWVVARARVAVAVLALCALASPSSSEAQSPSQIRKLGFITPTAQTAREQVFREELRRLGYTEGRDLVIEYRSADGRFDRLPDLVAELIHLKVDVIVARATQAALAAKKATATIPIVMIGVDDPVASGLVATLAHPGGNVTGTAAPAAEVVGKQFELLRDLLPRLSSVSVVWNPANPVFQKRQVAQAKAIATKLGMQLVFVEVRSPEQLDPAFATMAKQRTQAVLLLADPLFGTYAERIAQLVLKHRLPTVYGAREFAEAGGLAAYGPSYNEAYQGAAAYVDKLWKGRRAADLPVEQTTKFDLIVNAKTAKTLGIAIPPSVLSRADLVLN